MLPLLLPSIAVWGNGPGLPMTLLAMAGSADVEAEAGGLATTVVSVDADALRLSLLVACASLKEACPTTSSWLRRATNYYLLLHFDHFNDKTE